MIDTHCHLNFKAFANILDKTIKEAESAGINTIIVPGAKLDSSQIAVDLAQKYPLIYAAVGIHPVHVEKDLQNYTITELSNKLKKLAKNNKVVAIGEIGLDYWRNDGFINKKKLIKNQKQVFTMQVRLAQELNLPLIIHNRVASDDIINILKTLGSKFNVQSSKLVFHCFAGQEKIWQFVENNPKAYIGLNGFLTYNPKLQKIVRNIPLEKIVLETDSPYLKPRIPGQKLVFPNTPANTALVARYLAELKTVNLDKIAQVTTNNAKKIFEL